ncbi:aminotransferase class I/II-fold pyridoxal phosphate-dependent enzyme [Pelagibacterales bacterium SAG-MED33]|nr:aminotransferase class I/II-fold pyridoxal phosphate-dependent enzyme [Pelagibacterales bacterium SAG-MED33]
MNYPLTYSTWNNKEKTAISKIVKSSFYSMGKTVELFEKKFAKKLNRKFAVMVNSGSSANLIGFSSLLYKAKKYLKEGDEVIVPAIAWSTTYSPLKYLGLKLKIIDINLEDLNIDTHKLKKAISKKTKMIVTVSILGVPVNLNEVEKICKKKNIIFFNDNCESLGSKIKKRQTGNFGDIATHSFFYSHHISTMEGGMCVTDNFELYCIMKSLRAHGWSRELPKKNPFQKNKKKIEYNFVLPGFNVRPGEIHAAVGLEQLKKLNKLISYREKNWKLFYNLFKDDKRFYIQQNNFNNKNASFALTFIIRNTKKINKDKIYDKLKKNQIAYRLITGGCFTEHPYRKFFDYKIYDNLKNAKKAHKDGFFVGNAGQDLSYQIMKLHKVLKDI